MDSDNIGWLTTVPSTDINFKGALKRATDDEIRESLRIMDVQYRLLTGKPIGNKTRIAALERELRKRERREKHAT